MAPAFDGWLGVYVEDAAGGPVVVEVIPASPAAKAGLQAGDRLLGVGDRATPTHAEFVAAIRAAKVGETVAIRLQRDGKERVVSVELGSRPEVLPPVATIEPQPLRGGKPAPAPTPAAEPAPAAAGGRGYLGLSVREVDGSVRIERVIDDSPAAKAALQAGARVLAVDGKPIAGLPDLDRALAGKGPGSEVEFEIVDGEQRQRRRIALGAAPGATSVAPPPPAPAAAPRSPATLEAELAALRAELAELRRQVESLRRGRQE